MDPNNLKAHYFRAFAQLKTDDYDGALKTCENLLQLDALHTEGKKLMAQIKKER